MLEVTVDAKLVGKKIPYQCQVFVCVNDRQGAKKSCADGGSAQLRLALKAAAEKKWPADVVRVSQSLCQGLCQHGPNVLVYPHNLWFSAVTLDDVDTLIREIERLLQQGRP